MRGLLVSDLHYDLRKYDWVLEQAADIDLLVIAGDLLNIASAVPLDTQIHVVLEYLARSATHVTTVVCSGNHDLDHRGDDGEKITSWLAEARTAGVVVDGDSTEAHSWLVTACAWWEGPETLRRLEANLADAAQRRTGPWLWAWHGPPEGPLAWTGSRYYGDPELPRLLDIYRPDVVLCGHVHEAPFCDGGAWIDQRNGTWLFNSGRQGGPIPAHIAFDLDARAAWWWSPGGHAEADFAVTGA